MTDPSQPLFLFGPGYCAQALAELWKGPVRGTYRSEGSLDKLNSTRIAPVSVTKESDLSQAIASAHVVVSVPPSDDHCPAFQTVGKFAPSTASITYLSTTGVYGDMAGGWAMDWTPVSPQSKRAERRVLAEQCWRDASDRVRIVRLPGIYGPGRSAFDRLKTGSARRIVKAGQVFSRAHVDDIASGLDALISQQAYGLFNLCDDLAAPPQDVVSFAAQCLKLPAPPEIQFEDADLSPMARSFYSECKRVSNARLKAVTGWRPKYPTYREGLSAIHAMES